MASSYQEGQVKIYDSLFNRKLAPSLEVQLAQLYGPATTDSSILVTAEAVQQQQGETDCGLFSLAEKKKTLIYPPILCVCHARVI